MNVLTNTLKTILLSIVLISFSSCFFNNEKNVLSLKCNNDFQKIRSSSKYTYKGKIKVIDIDCFDGMLQMYAGGEKMPKHKFVISQLTKGEVLYNGDWYGGEFGFEIINGNEKSSKENSLKLEVVFYNTKK